MLSAVGLVPSSPLLLHSVNKHRREELGTTEHALDTLADDWYARGIETVVIITPSRFAYEQAIGIDVADPYIADLATLGDLSPKATYHPDSQLIDRLQRTVRHEHAQGKFLPLLTLSTEPALPFGCAAPLAALAKRIPSLRIVPISPGQNLPAKEHYHFGTLLKQTVDESSKRIGILAAGDVSLNHLADIRLILEEKSTASLLKLQPELNGHDNDASYQPLAMLFGVLDGIPAHTDIISIESPFAIGYVIANLF